MLLREGIERWRHWNEAQILRMEEVKEKRKDEFENKEEIEE